MTATPQILPPVQMTHLNFSGFDHFAEAVKEWDLDWQQLDRGKLDAELLTISSANTLVYRVAFSRRFLQRGSPPPGTRTFGILGETVGEIDWCRDRATSEDLLVFSSESGYESVSQPGFNGNTLSIADAHLDEVASIIGVPLNLELFGARATAVQVNGSLVANLRRRLLNLDNSVNAGAEATNQEWLRNELEFEIPAQLIRSLASQSSTTPLDADHSRPRTARKARDFIDAHAEEPPTILEVCHASGVSWRTLNYAFRDLFDMTPKQYLQAVRLNGVRRDIMRATADTSIADVANNWGFWHIGQFSADYRQHFGELPSLTRRRVM